MLDNFDGSIAQLSQAVEQEAKQRPGVRRLMTHPGVGPLTALAFLLTIGPWERFGCGNQVAIYLGLIPSEYSSGGQQRLGHISKQGNTLAAGGSGSCRSSIRSSVATALHPPEPTPATIRRYRRCGP